MRYKRDVLFAKTGSQQIMSESGNELVNQETAIESFLRNMGLNNRRNSRKSEKWCGGLRGVVREG